MLLSFKYEKSSEKYLFLLLDVQFLKMINDFNVLQNVPEKQGQICPWPLCIGLIFLVVFDQARTRYLLPPFRTRTSSHSSVVFRYRSPQVERIRGVGSWFFHRGSWIPDPGSKRHQILAPQKCIYKDFNTTQGMCSLTLVGTYLLCTYIVESRRKRNLATSTRWRRILYTKI